MARGKREEHNPNRRVDPPAFGLGDVVHVPPQARRGRGFPGGPVTVDRITGKGRFFSGISPEGHRLRTTSINLAAGDLEAGIEPWRIERRGSIGAD